MILKMKRKAKVIFLIVLLVFVGIFIWWLKPSLRLRSEKSIRSSYLRKTPLNSTSQEVLSFVKKNWAHEKHDLIEIPAYDHSPIGTSHIGPVEIGTYWQHFPGLPAIGYIYITWAFDENDRLIDVIVHKGIDAV